MVSDTLPVIFLMGPTASGKTSLAAALKQRLPLEIISVDSAMVFKGMDIGTAKPGPEILEIAPHHLIDICDPAEIYSAGRFRDDALALIAQIHAQHRIPLLTGGTGLYFRTLEQGLSDIPPADPQIRARLEQMAHEKGWGGMHRVLAKIDPETAAKIHQNDPQRIQRALEVYEITGKPLSKLFADGRSDPLPNRIIKLVISPGDRRIIHQRVKQRFYAMVELGLLNEVRLLYERGDLAPTMPSMRMVGYRQVWKYLDGKLDYQRMLEHAVIATRQLAKRQMTWLRAEHDAMWFEAVADDILDNTLKFITRDPVFNLLA